MSQKPQHRQGHENIISLASAINRIKRIIKNLSIEVKLKADDNLVEKLAAKYMCMADKALPHWDVFDGWLGEEEAVARVTRLEVLLTSNDTIQTNSKQQKSGQSRHPAKVPLWSSCCQHETHNCGEQG